MTKPTSEHWKILKAVTRLTPSPYSGYKLSRKHELAGTGIPHSAIYLITDEINNTGQWFFMAERGIYLGKGDLGVVKIVYDETGNSYAIKTECDSPLNEIAILKKLGRFHAYGQRLSVSPIKSGVKYYTLQQLFLGKSLEQYKIKEMPSRLQQRIFLSLCEKMLELNLLGITHGDLWPKNIILDLSNSIELTIIDFNLSKFDESPTRQTSISCYLDLSRLGLILEVYFDYKRLCEGGLLPHEFLRRFSYIRIESFNQFNFLSSIIQDIKNCTSKTDDSAEPLIPNQFN